MSGWIGVNILVAAIMAGCDHVRGFPSDRTAATKLSAQLGDPGSSVIDFPTIAPFQWSRLFVFGSYMSEERAERVLGFDWPFRWPPIEHQDGDAFFVLVDSNRVVSALHYQYAQARITGIERLFRADGYPRDSARFRLVPDTAAGLPYRSLVWRP